MYYIYIIVVILFQHTLFRNSRNSSPSATNVVLVLDLGVVVSTKAFSFHNRSSSDFAHRLVASIIHNKCKKLKQSKTPCKNDMVNSDN